MAKVRLQGYGGPVEGLPAVCMRCGAPASVRKRKTFSWFPGWVYILLIAGLLPFAIIALISTRRRTVEAPLCEEHKNHWFVRQAVVLSSLLFLIVFGIGSLGAAGGDDNITALVCFGWLIALVGWLVLAAVIQSTSIRPVNITDTTITLVGVSEEFVQAYRQELPRVPVDELVSEHWQQSRGRPFHPGRHDPEESDRVQRPGKDANPGIPPDAYSQEAP